MRPNNNSYIEKRSHQYRYGTATKMYQKPKNEVLNMEREHLHKYKAKRVPISGVIKSKLIDANYTYIEDIVVNKKDYVHI